MREFRQNSVDDNSNGAYDQKECRSRKCEQTGTEQMVSSLNSLVPSSSIGDDELRRLVRFSLSLGNERFLTLSRPECSFLRAIAARISLHIHSTPTEMRLGFLSLLLFVRVGGDAYFANLDAEAAALQKKDFVTYAALHGMNLSIHEVVTPDRWILQLWRVRCMNIYDGDLSTPVILFHGFGGTAFDFLWNIRNESAAFIFADNGYDVWLANWRGNHFSNRIQGDGGPRRPNTTDYYRVSWQEMADMDLPTILDKVLNETDQDKVYIVGHSMGGTIPFAFLSGNHAYDDKISHYASLTPVLKFGYDTPFPLILGLKVGVPVTRLMPKIVFKQLYGTQQFAYPNQSFEAFVQSAVCKIIPICRLMNDAVLGRDMRKLVVTDSHVNKSRLPVYLAEEVGGLTMMTSLNFLSQWMKDPWTKIDFDFDAPQSGFTNLGQYNTEKPPKYDFAAIKVAFSMFYVENDSFNGPESTQAVIEMLHARDVKHIEGNKFSHIDVVLATDARCYIYDDVLAKLNELETDRDQEHEDFRSDVETHLKELPFENGCLGKTN